MIYMIYKLGGRQLVNYVNHVNPVYYSDFDVRSIEFYSVYLPLNIRI